MSDALPFPDWQSDPKSLKPFADVRLIAVDLDGTFVLEDGAVAEQVQSLQRGLWASRQGHPGVRLTYATGRSLTWVQSLEARLQTRIPSGTPLVLYNGSVVAEAATGVVLDRREIALDALESILKVVLAREGASVFAYSGPHEILASPAREVVAAWSSSSERPEYDVNGVEIEWDPPDSRRFEPVAILVTVEDSALEQLTKELGAVGGISITSGGPTYLEVRPPGSSKATGLRAATDRLGIDRRDVLALGDSDNDVEMLEWAGVAVVVSGATDRARASSDYVTRFGPSRGVLEVLRGVKFARRYFQATSTGRISGREKMDV